jgi:hypothetical protein
MLENAKEHLGDLGIDGRIILIIEKYSVRMWT